MPLIVVVVVVVVVVLSSCSYHNILQKGQIQLKEPASTEFQFLVYQLISKQLDPKAFLIILWYFLESRDYFRALLNAALILRFIKVIELVS